ncbi:hypothetical protein CLTEP_13130 [Clostridium tepidiprofundi DSM 19306]|uniref:Y_Y_Y domain protein n=1 Tax=Clostridium tepidiprofundi DSM 19306 TaxID=1121338 RepID=A0A151B4A1_9CLOT|nr:hypothetical protein [Clostridium tepidiprofundi]KYH34716.1 hypothetical protein CLTEP_13130 [Clostridium tepidiprofundi DSM 19306]
MRKKSIVTGYFIVCIIFAIIIFNVSDCLSVKAVTTSEEKKVECIGNVNCFFIDSSFINILAKGNEIIVEVKYNGNQNIEKCIQIWGNSGNGWVLVKDFDSTLNRTNHAVNKTKNSTNNNDINKTSKTSKTGKTSNAINLSYGNKKYVYTWNLRNIDKYNESYYKPYLKKNEGIYKVYVRYKKGRTYREFYKTFYLKADNTLEETKIITSFDLWNNAMYANYIPLIMNADINDTKINGRYRNNIDTNSTNKSGADTSTSTSSTDISSASKNSTDRSSISQSSTNRSNADTSTSKNGINRNNAYTNSTSSKNRDSTNKSNTSGNTTKNSTSATKSSISKNTINRNSMNINNVLNSMFDDIENFPMETFEVTDSPVVAYQNVPFLIFTIKNDSSLIHAIRIVGYNDTALNENIDRLDLCLLDRNVWIWTPKRSGIFNIVAYDSYDKPIAKRKVYVNSENNKYLQLDALKIWNDDNNTHVAAKIAKSKPCGFDENENKIMKFTISEPHVWSKTIKNYGDVVRKSTNNKYKNYYEINEKNDNFKFNYGNYLVGVTIKSKYSIEYEDAKCLHYNKSSYSNLKLNIIMDTTNTKEDSKGKYPTNSKFTFTANIGEKNITDKNDIEYAFLLWDARGKKLIKQYRSLAKDNEANKLNWTPADPGKYIIYARVRRRSINNNLPNSYEAEVAYPIEIFDSRVGKINIEKISIDNMNVQDIINNKEAITSHEMHYLKIKADYVNTKCNNNGIKANQRLMYKVYAIHDGYWQMLSSYSKINKIPFYPKSYGEYKIIVLVKDSLSGAGEVRKEFNINVKKNCVDWNWCWNCGNN